MVRFRCLSHDFGVAADRGGDLAAVRAALEPFEIDDAEDDPAVVYELRGTESGRFSLVVDGRAVRVSDDPVEPLDLLLWYVGEHTVLAETRLLLLHAGAVLAPNERVLLLPGPSGSGKSTTTYGLLRAGYGYLSDEFAVVDPESARVCAFPRPLALKAGTRELVPDLDSLAVLAPADRRHTVHVPARRVGPGVDDRFFDAGWVVFPRYEPHAPTELQPLSPGETCVELMGSTFRPEGRASVVLETFARVARQAPGYRMTIGDLDEAVQLLRQLTQAPARRGANPGNDGHPQRVRATVSPESPESPNEPMGVEPMEELELHAAEPTGISADEISLDLVTNLRPSVGTAFLDDEAVLLDPATGVSHLLDATATLVVRCLDGRSSLGEIAADIADVLEIDPERVAADVVSLMRTLGENGLLEGVERDAHAGHQHPSAPEGVPVGADLSAWSGWSELAAAPGPAVVVSWGTSCGFCTRISAELAQLGPQMEVAGTRLVLVTTGSPEELHDQVGESALPVLHVASTPSFFEGLGTPVAYLVTGERVVAEPLALGADRVPELCRSVLGQQD
jgi:hypothetical protein